MGIHHPTYLLGSWKSHILGKEGILSSKVGLGPQEHEVGHPDYYLDHLSFCPLQALESSQLCGPPAATGRMWQSRAGH